MDTRIKITKIPGPVAIPFSSDRLIEIEFLDPRTGSVNTAFTGASGILASRLFASLGEEREDKLVAEIGPDAIRLMIPEAPNG